MFESDDVAIVIRVSIATPGDKFARAKCYEIGDSWHEMPDEDRKEICSEIVEAIGEDVGGCLKSLRDAAETSS